MPDDEKKSTLPTLLRTGYIKPNPNLKLSKSAITCIKNQRGIDYIMNFIGDRIPIIPGGVAKISARSIGDKVIVLKSDTGSGKSTVMPPFLYEKFQERTRKNIAVTQPRILTAIDIAEGLPEYYSFLKMDDNLGYSTGDYKRVPLNPGVIFMTIGILLAQLKIMDDEAFMRKYSFILIDEVHERDLNVDTSLFMLKKFLATNYKDPLCPVIILMSATFKPSVFMNYYNCPPENYIQVVGATFPIEKNFLKYDTTNFIKYTIDKAEEIHISNIADIEENSEYRDIIIFVSGAAYARTVLEKLHLFNAKVLSNPFSNVLQYLDDKKKEEKLGGVSDDKRYYIAPIDLNSKTFYASGAEYQNMFSNIANISIPIYNITNNGDIDVKSINRWVKPSRRIIVATPIAETGVTIETLRYCIDTGLYTSVNFNPDFAIKSIISKDITQGMSTQRKGRVGRKSPGKWYPCYTEDAFNAMEVDQFARILTDDITTELIGIFIKETETSIIENMATDRSNKFIYDNNLFVTNYMTDNSYYHLNQLKSLNVSAIDFLESPSANSLVYSTEKLYGLGFIDSQYNPTTLGVYANKIRKISMESRRMILAGYSHGANILDLITIVSFIEVERMNFMNTYKYKPININPKKFTDKEYEFYYKVVIGDEFVEYLFIWEMYSEMLDTMMKQTKANASKGKPYIFDISNVEQWCMDNKLKYAGLNKIAMTRDSIIESFISMGIDPYWNGLGVEKGTYSLLKMFRTNIEECVAEVKKIKKCVLDGFRFNLLVWDNTSKKYILQHRNIPVHIRSPVLSRMGDDAVQTNANFVISSNIMLRQCQNNKDMFQFEHSGSISILDAYLDIDLGFLNH
jgi:HrpA-like RNA helicase